MVKLKAPPDPWADDLKIRVPKSKKLSREKGHKFERDTANRFRSIFPEARRHLEYQSSAAVLGIDIINTGNYRIQCKRTALYVNPSRIFEIKIDPNETVTPVLITKADRQPTLAVLPFDKLMELIEFHEKYKNIETDSRMRIKQVQ